MALKSGSLGTLLQGVSQQPDRVRLDGQVTEQINMVSDVTRGLSTRPATEDVSSLSGASLTHNFTNITYKGNTFILGFKRRDMRVWDLLGREYNVAPAEGALDYMSDDMRFHVVDDNIVLLNRSRTVRMNPTLDTTSWYASMFHALGGQFSKTYKIEVTFDDGTVCYGEYTTPDGTSSGDAALTAADEIVGQLVISLLADTNLPADTSVEQFFDVAVITHPSMQSRIVTSDGVAGDVLRSVADTTQDVANLPKFAPNGMIVKVLTSNADEDDYWLKFKAEGVDVEDGSAGLGSEGTWIEWYDPLEVRSFDLSTVPHVMYLDSGSFVIEAGPWLPRQVGDSTTSPEPSIVGKTIRDLGGFENRIVLLSPDSVVMSRTGEQFDLWRESATVLVSTDPVDITSTKKDSLKLDWLVPFDRDLYLFADPGDSQFVIRGGGIDPSTVSMVLTTEFDMRSGGTPPITTGRTILFPFNYGAYSGLSEFFTDSDVSVNMANSLTETQDKYLEGNVREMCVSQNFKMALLATDSRDHRDTLWVYKYLWDGRDPLQSSWSKWQFSDTVEFMFFDSSKVYVIGSDAHQDVFLHVMDLNRPDGDYGYPVMLDRSASVTATDASQGLTQVTLPFECAKFQQGAGCANPGLEATPSLTVRLNLEEVLYMFSSAVVPVNSVMLAGQGVTWSLEPTQVFARDYQNRIDTSKKVTIQDYVVHVDDSGSFKAVGYSPYSTGWEFYTPLFPMDNEPLDPDRLLLHTGPHFIPWGERADWSRVVFTGDDIRPVTIHEVAWVGQVLTTKGRRI